MVRITIIPPMPQSTSTMWVVLPSRRPGSRAATSVRSPPGAIGHAGVEPGTLA
jgi:hypothetical protein